LSKDLSGSLRFVQALLDYKLGKRNSSIERALTGSKEIKSDIFSKNLTNFLLCYNANKCGGKDGYL
jgi:hypothetical protein